MPKRIWEDDSLSSASNGRRGRWYGLLLWIRGALAIVERLLGRDDAPVGQVGGLISPLLEVLRTGKAASWVKGQRVLDCGCGRAKILQMLSREIHYTGLDRDPDMADHLRRRHPNGCFLCMDVELEDLATNEQFDCLLMTAILEHLAHPEATLQRWVRHVRPGGRVVMTTPVPLGHRLLDLGSRLKVFDRAASEDHKHPLGRAELEHLIAACELELVVYQRFAFGGNQLVVASKPSGPAR